ncbi:MAG: metallophosphoesterase [Actinomycetota bacterium]|jgi:Icc protein|nr:metallophosphoesterase [Actinomycetota bacterium]
MVATVLQLSDTHLRADPSDTSHQRHPDARLRSAIEAAAEAVAASGTAVDLVLLTGDLTDDASEEACRRVALLVAPLGAPVLAVPGNHDAGPEVTATFGPPRPVEVGEWRVAAAASNLAGRIDGGVDPAGLLAAIDALDDRPTVLAVHHPPAGPSSHPWFQLAGAGELLAGLEGRPHVRIVASGHLHQPFEVRRGRLAILGAPSTLYGIRHSGDGWAPDDTIPTGGRLLILQPDGAWRSELVTT